MDPQVCFETEAVDDGYQTTDRVQWCSGNGSVGQDVPSTARENGVERGNGIGGACHGDGIDGFHEAGGGHQEGRVDGAARGGDDLASAAVDGFGSEGDVCEAEFGVANCWGR